MGRTTALLCAKRKWIALSRATHVVKAGWRRVDQAPAWKRLLRNKYRRTVELARTQIRHRLVGLAQRVRRGGRHDTDLGRQT